jgi:deoxycytidylate deaminase
MKFMRVAQASAATSTHPKAQIGAVLVLDKSIISIGVNGEKSHPLQAKYNEFRFQDDGCKHLLHAEIAALAKGRWYQSLANATMYIYRTMKEGGHGICRPCPGCLQALKDHRIQNIIYTTGYGIAAEDLPL